MTSFSVLICATDSVVAQPPEFYTVDENLAVFWSSRAKTKESCWSLDDILKIHV